MHQDHFNDTFNKWSTYICLHFFKLKRLCRKIHHLDIIKDTYTNIVVLDWNQSSLFHAMLRFQSRDLIIKDTYTQILWCLLKSIVIISCHAVLSIKRFNYQRYIYTNIVVLVKINSHYFMPCCAFNYKS